MSFPPSKDDGGALLKRSSRIISKKSVCLFCGTSLAVAFDVLFYAGRCSILILFLQLVCCVEAALLLRQLRRRPRRVEGHGDALLQRIRYHFLFNTLNATVCLIKPRPDVAETTLENLSEIFRTMLSQEKQTTLAEEIRLARRYVEIERLRLGERLHVEWRLDCGETDAIRVPALILQPLIENAIYHGIEKQPTGGTVHVAVVRRGRRLVIHVRNPVSGTDRHRRGNRVAQKNIRLVLAGWALFRPYHGSGRERDAHLRRIDAHIQRLRHRAQCTRDFDR